MGSINWNDAVKPLIKKYKGRKHPLEAKNLYQLLVMVILSAQDSDKHINQIAPQFFEAYPDMSALSKASVDSLLPLLRGVRNFGNKSRWLVEVALMVKKDKEIPLTMEELVALPGIGRKSANVIMREGGAKAVGVMVDLHVLRVADRLSIASGIDPKKMEQQIMKAVDEKHWGEVGMAISFLGREICRPSNPKCPECIMKNVCAFYLSGAADLLRKT
jgi:endonuclease-3